MGKHVKSLIASADIQRNVICENCEAEYEIIYDRQEGRYSYCTFCGETLNDIEEDDEIDLFSSEDEE